MSEFEMPGDAATSATPSDDVSGEDVPGRDVSGEGVSGDGAVENATPASPVTEVMRELDTIADRDLSEHPDVYQRIHTELQSALSTIDDA